MPGIESVRPPANPWRLARWLWRLVGDVVEEYKADRVGDLAASITFWTLLSIPAAVLALISALGVLEPVVGTSVTDDLRATINDYLQQTFTETRTLTDAVDELFERRQPGLITVSTLVAVYTLSRGLAGLIRALDSAYEIDDSRSWVHLRLVAVGLGLGTILIVGASASMLATLPELGFTPAARALTVLFVLGVLIGWSATVFHVGPYHHTPWRYDVPGAVLTTVGWIVASQGYALYLRVAPDGNQVQTSVGAVLLALTLMYLLSVVLLLGAELNDVLARRAGVVQQPEEIPVRRYVDRLREWRAGWPRSRRPTPSEHETDEPDDQTSAV